MTSVPTTLPDDVLHSTTEFRLTVSAASYPTIISTNTITIKVANESNITGKITCNGVTGNTDVVYGKGSDYSIDLTFNLYQNSNPYTALTGTTYA